MSKTGKKIAEELSAASTFLRISAQKMTEEERFSLNENKGLLAEKFRTVYKCFLQV